jgi:hypothetical protein
MKFQEFLRVFYNFLGISGVLKKYQEVLYNFWNFRIFKFLEVFGNSEKIPGGIENFRIFRHFQEF